VLNESVAAANLAQFLQKLPACDSLQTAAELRPAQE
jgi:hypothetical protein